MEHADDVWTRSIKLPQLAARMSATQRSTRASSMPVGQLDDLQADLGRVVDARRRLGPGARSILAACSREQVNLGIEAGLGANSYVLAVAPELKSRSPIAESR